MGATYTRQSTYSDGDTITAAHTNDEFDQLVAAFAASTGHTHDGTTGEGGPITALATNAITFGTGADTDIAITFDANTSDGVLTWKEDEDYFEFSDDILMSTTEKLQFRDTALYINSSTDGQLDIVADTEVQIAATTIDINGNVDISGTLTIGSAGISEAELEILDGATVTTTELNILDGNTSIGTTAVSDGHGIVMNHGGTMAQTTVQTLAAYLDDEITAMPNLTSVGTLTTLTVDNIVINGTNIGHTSDTDAIAIASDGDVTFSQDVVITGDLTVSGDDITMGTNTAGNLLIADGTNFNSVAVGSLSEISTVANDDVFIAVDTSGGGLKKITRSAIVSGLAASGAISNVADDSTPQLGGDLDMNGQDIVTTSNADIELAPNGTGHVTIKGNTNQGTLQLNCENNSHGQQIKAAPHSESASNVLTLPSTGGDARLVSTSSTATLTNKTIDASQLSGTVANARLDAQLQDVAGLAVTDGGFIVGDGSNFVLETGSTARASIGADNASNISSGTLGAARMAAAQTAITSILATDVKIGEDDETKIDFETADEIHFYAANAEQVFVSDGVFGPQTDSDVDLGTTGARFKDAFIDSVTVTGDVAVGDDVTVAGRASGHVTTDNDGSFDLSVGNDFKCTPSGNFTLTFTNATAGQSGNILLINSGGHTVSAHADVAITATALTALTTAGTYHLGYYCSASSGNNTIAVSASGALT